MRYGLSKKRSFCEWCNAKDDDSRDRDEAKRNRGAAVASRKQCFRDFLQDLNFMTNIAKFIGRLTLFILNRDLFSFI